LGRAFALVAMVGLSGCSSEKPAVNDPGKGSTTQANASADRDGDGIPDATDKCPDEPEDVNGYQDDDGCRDCVTIHALPAEPVVFGRLYFSTDSAKPRLSDQPVLDGNARLMQTHPDLLLVEVAGHSDSTEKDENVSRERAEAVVAELVKRGIDRKRLSPVAHGAKRPLGNGSNSLQRAKNRRVELAVVKREKAQSQPRTGGPPPCK
jgi:outer membrane protein OmpA-like peptidoglycan-associated protein